MPRTTTRIDSPSITKQRSMLRKGENLTIEADIRNSVGGAQVAELAEIDDRAAHDAWMQEMYNNADNGINVLVKPPANERQLLTVQLEDDDPAIVTRFQDGNGWRWRMDVDRDSVNDLALHIQDVNDTFLYASGPLMRNETDDGWYTECPTDKATPTIENVYFRWMLSDAPISNNFVYEASSESREGVVRSDPDYD